MLFPAVPGMAQFHDPRVPQKTLEISGNFVKSQKIQQAFYPYAGLWLETPHNRVVSFHIRP